MTARDLYNAYMRGHHMVQLEGEPNHDLLMELINSDLDKEI